MADDCFDDEVLLENSPLSQYLRETCPDQEFDTVPSARMSVQPAVEKENYTISGIAHATKELTWKFFRWLYPSVVEHVDMTFFPEYSTLAVESRCLFESDKQIVCAYYPKNDFSKSRGISLASYNRIWFFGFCSLFFLCYDLCAGVHHLPTSLASGLPYLPAVHLSLYPVLQVACYLYTPFLIHLLWTVFTLKRRHKKGIRCMKQCLRLLDQHGVLLRKCIRYIQEVEVISRGFTMVTPYTPIIRLENSTSSTTRRQCAVLRQSCFIAAKCQFSSLRDATLTGMRQLPLLAEIDHVSNYLATVDLQTIAPWFKSSEDDDELRDGVAEYTSHYSLSALKAMNSLFCEQRSEFIRRLALSISPAALLPDQTMGKSVLESWTSIVCAVNESCEASLGKLQRSYDCHRQRPSHNREQLPSDIQTQATDGASSQHRVINAVRSLRLHLEATLNRVISVEDALEETDGSITKENKVGCLTSEMLDAVKRELTASQDCLQEASSSLEKINDKHQCTTQNQDIEGEEDEQQEATQDNRVPIPLLPYRDTEIEFDDQVFEAYTENEPWERCDEDDWGEGISEQEKLRRRREAEETKRLLQELRSVLSVRKAERENMKLNRARTDGETNNTTTANELLENISASYLNVRNENTGLESRTSGDAVNGRDLPNEDCELQESSAAVATDHAVGGDAHMPSVRSRDKCKLGDREAMNESETESKQSHESKQTDTQSVDEMAKHQSSNNADQLDTCRFRDSTKLATAEGEEHQTQFRLPFNFLPSLAAEAAKKSRLQAEEMFIGSDEESEE